VLLTIECCKPMKNKVLAIIVRGYPRLSETFISQEILALEKRGLKIQIYTLLPPTDHLVHSVHEEITATVTYLPDAPLAQTGRMWRAYKTVRKLSGYKAALWIFLKDLARDLTIARCRRFGQAIALAHEMPGTVGHIYSHYLNRPTSVARYAAIMRQLPFSFSAHAKDIWTTPEWEKREKIADAAWGTTCTRFGRNHLAGLASVDEQNKIMLTYHGLDVARFPKPPQRREMRDGTDREKPVRIVSVGRGVAKKGFDDLFNALALLNSNLHWSFTHIGDGALLEQMRQQVKDLGLNDRFNWLGAQTREVVIETLRSGDLFILASKIDADGDRDGLPNVLMEALSQKLPVLATDVSGIPELITHGDSGWLVPPGNSEMMAEAAEKLIKDPALRKNLAEAGFKRLQAEFTLDKCLVQIAGRFGVG